MAKTKEDALLDALTIVNDEIAEQEGLVAGTRAKLNGLRVEKRRLEKYLADLRGVSVETVQR